MEDQIGVIKPDAFADIVVFEGKMETDIRKSPYQAKLVMKDGEITLMK